MKKFSLWTTENAQFVDITGQVQKVVRDLGLARGAVTVFVPHTTAGVTINEHADPDVVHDVLRMLDRLVPWRDPEYRHREGNSAAHVKALLTGSSVRVLVEKGLLQLGSWQGIFFCEFDGPRDRQVWISAAEEASAPAPAAAAPAPEAKPRKKSAKQMILKVAQPKLWLKRKGA